MEEPDWVSFVPHEGAYAAGFYPAVAAGDEPFGSVGHAWLRQASAASGTAGESGRGSGR